MAIVVEDGTIVSGANSYVSESELSTYATARGVTLTGDTEELLIRAMDYVDSLDFIGIKYTKDQALQWPRASAVVDGYTVDSDEIPTELKNGLMQVAMAVDNGEDPLADLDRRTSSTTVGPVSVTYSDGSSSAKIVRKINASLKKLIRSTGNSFKVSR